MAATNLLPKPAAFIACCLLLAIALPGLAMALRVDPATATLIRGGAEAAGVTAAAGRRHLSDAPGGVTCSTIHWCWGKTETYSGWCPGANWDGVSTGGEPRCSEVNPNDSNCTPGTYLDSCDGGVAALDYFLYFYGVSDDTKAVCKSIVHAMCNCDWCGAATAAEGLIQLAWGPASDTNLAKLTQCCHDTRP